MIVKTHITFKDHSTPADLDRAGLSKEALARLAKASFESILKLAEEPGCTYSIEVEVSENE